MAGELENYEYSDLAAPQLIRLVTFTSREHIVLHMETFLLSDAPVYRALSYAWGRAIVDEEGQASHEADEVVTRAVEVDGRKLQVSENLFHALEQLRSADVGYIWIDAICINQENLEERSAQILLMGDIFSGAEKVIAWLGNDPSDVDVAEWVQRDVAPLYADTQKMPMRFDNTLAVRIGLTSGEVVDNWQRVHRFICRRRWFARAWVVQETTLAQRIELVNGPVTLDWDVLIPLTHAASNTGWMNSGTEGSYGLEVMRQWVKAKDQFLSESDLRNPEFARQKWFYNYFTILVAKMMRFSALIPHDKIYAGLGMVERMLGPGAAVAVVPNYEDAWVQLYTSMTIMALNEIPSIQFIALSHPAEGTREPLLPSWCPDYQLPIGMPLCTIDESILRCHFYSAAGLVKGTKPVFLQNDTVLSVSGKQVDVIEDCTANLVQLVCLGDPDISPHPIFEICSQLDPIYPHTHQHRLEVLWRTMLTDYYVVGDNIMTPAPSELAHSLECYILVQWAYEYFRIQEEGEDPSRKHRLLEQIAFAEKVFADSPRQLPTLAEVYQFSNELVAAFTAGHPKQLVVEEADKLIMGSMSGVGVVGKTRCLFRTRDQNFLGLGPDRLRVGDEVWLLKEAFTPFVLRRRENGQFTLVGEAYVHGIMHGEWLERKGDDGFDKIEIF